MSAELWYAPFDIILVIDLIADSVERLTSNFVV